MVKITRKERFELEALGVPMKDNGISSTLGKGKKKTYYLCEDPSNISKLNKIRNSKL